MQPYFNPTRRFMEQKKLRKMSTPQNCISFHQVQYHFAPMFPCKERDNWQTFHSTKYRVKNKSLPFIELYFSMAINKRETHRDIFYERRDFGLNAARKLGEGQEQYGTLVVQCCYK